MLSSQHQSRNKSQEWTIRIGTHCKAYHVKAVKSLLESEACCESIIDAGAVDDLALVGDELSQPLSWEFEGLGLRHDEAETCPA